jgi:SAM-dependent methyltransferase
MSRMTGELNDDGRITAPSTDRNKDPILEVLRRVLPDTGLVLEIASGTGQHVVHFAAALPRLFWQPTDLNREHLASISAWIRHRGLKNVHAPLELDVGSNAWPVDRAEAVVCCNMIHIAPWGATVQLLAGAARVLVPNGVLILYGPYRRFGRHTAPSNEAFDADLRGRNPEWGLRDMEEVIELAGGNSLFLLEVVPMPANNFSIVLRRSPPERAA